MAVSYHLMYCSLSEYVIVFCVVNILVLLPFVVVIFLRGYLAGELRSAVWGIYVPDFCAGKLTDVGTAGTR